MCSYADEDAICKSFYARARRAKPGTVIFPYDCSHDGMTGDKLRILGTEHRRGNMNKAAPAGCEFIFRCVPVPGNTLLTGAYVCVHTNSLTIAMLPTKEVNIKQPSTPVSNEKSTSVPPYSGNPSYAKACPKCGASIGERCLTISGNVAKLIHSARHYALLLRDDL